MTGLTKEALHCIAVLKGMASAQTKIAIHTVKNGAPAEVSSLDAGAAVGLLIALSVVGKTLGDKDAVRISHMLQEMGKFEELFNDILQCITDIAKTMPEGSQKALGIIVKSTQTQQGEINV